MSRIRSLFYLIFSFLSLGLSAQNGEVRGFIYDKQSGEPSIYTTIRVEGTDKGAVTDLNGYYSISKITPGKYNLLVSYLGYDTFRLEIDIMPNDRIQRNLYIQRSAITTKEVTVTAERTKNETRVEMSKTTATPREIEMIPSVGGQADLAQYLQVLPGVTFTGDQGGQLYVRGGAPIQNKVLLDGMTIYNPFHSIGLFSVFDVDILKNVDVYTGGFSAEYGGRISAIMDVTTRDGSKDKVGGKISVGPIASKISVEGPLKKFREGENNASFLFSARTSYMNQTAPVFYKYADSNGLPYAFTDLYGKITLEAGGGSKVSFFGFNFNDSVNFRNSTRYNWNAYGVGTKFVLLPPGSSTVIDGSFAYSNYAVHQIEKDSKPRNSSIDGFDATVNFSLYSGKDLIKYGFNVIGFQTDFNFTNSANRVVQLQDFTTEVAGYVRYNKVYKRFVFDPSFRLHYYAALGEASFEPRLGLKYVATTRLRLKVASGLYSQNLISAQSDRDVVNLFYGFITGPNDLPKQFNGQDVSTDLQKAVHLLGGFEYDLKRGLSLEVEGYIKYFNQLTNINRNKIFDNTADFASKPESLKNDFIRETGKSYGGDIKMVYDVKPFYFWAVYSLMWVTRFDGNVTYYPHWDRRHTVNLVASYDFGKNKARRPWRANARFTFGSGFPFTKTQGYYEQLDFQGGLNTNYTTANGKLGTLYGDQNSGRLSDFNRLDVSIQRSFFLKKDRKVVINASATNVYNQKNIFYFDRVKYARVNQLPILPSITVTYQF